MDLNLIIKKPVVTEKSMGETENHCYTFLVDRKANKNQIAQAAEQLFKVDVLKVRTVRLAGKTKRIGKKGKIKKFPDNKKAIIEIKHDQKIEAFPTGEKGKKKKKR